MQEYAYSVLSHVSDRNIEYNGPNVDRPSCPHRPIWSSWQLEIAMMVLFQGYFCHPVIQVKPPPPQASLSRGTPERGQAHARGQSKIARIAMLARSMTLENIHDAGSNRRRTASNVGHIRRSQPLGVCRSRLVVLSEEQA